MNNTFEWNRFCKVVAKDMRNLWPMFGVTLLILAVLPFALWLLLLVIGDGTTLPPDLRLALVVGLAMLAAIMTPSRLYRTWNLRGYGVYYAMLPASKLEKFLSALLYSLIVCPLVVYLGGLLLDSVLAALPFGPYRQWLWQGDLGFPFPMDFSRWNWMESDLEGVDFRPFGTLFNICCWLGYISSVSLFLFTSTLFRRHKVLQTFLWLYLIQFVLSIVGMPIAIALVGNVDFSDWLQQVAENMDPQRLLDWMFGIVIGVNLVEIGLFGGFAWCRLKRMSY